MNTNLKIALGVAAVVLVVGGTAAFFIIRSNKTKTASAYQKFSRNIIFETV